MTNNTTGHCEFSTAFSGVNTSPDYCAIGVVAAGGVLIVVVFCIVCFTMLFCCSKTSCRCKRKKSRLASVLKSKHKDAPFA